MGMMPGYIDDDQKLSIYQDCKGISQICAKDCQQWFIYTPSSVRVDRLMVKLLEAR
jgi:hypothetical protein